MQFLAKLQGLMDATRKADFLGPLALRLYLVPVFWVAGTNKVKGFGNVVEWFGNPDWGLGLPFPAFVQGFEEYMPLAVDWGSRGWRSLKHSEPCCLPRLAAVCDAQYR